jgi:hypothetical protein
LHVSLSPLKATGITNIFTSPVLGKVGISFNSLSLRYGKTVGAGSSIDEELDELLLEEMLELELGSIVDDGKFVDEEIGLFPQETSDVSKIVVKNTLFL